jgi:hypothetical protein
LNYETNMFQEVPQSIFIFLGGAVTTKFGGFV